MKRKVLLIIIPILIILIVGIVLMVLYFTTDLFKSTTDLFWKYFAQNEDIIKIMKNDKIEEQSQFKQNNSYISSGDLTATIEKGESSYKQLDVATTSKHDVTTGRTYADATIKNGDIDLFQVSYINCNDIYAIKCDEVFANYVGIRNSGLSELATSYGIDNAENIPDSINIDDLMNLIEFTDEQKQHILDTYSPIISNNILNTQYTKTSEQIQINGISYNTNVYGVELTGENIKQIMVNCLNALKTDTETLVLISNKLSTIGFGIEYTDTTNLISKIDEFINQIQQTSIENNLNIYVYESDGNTIRTIILLENVINITYDRGNNINTLTIDVTHANTNNTNHTNEDSDMNIISSGTNEIQDTNGIEISTNESQNSDEIINLNSQQDNIPVTSRVIITKNTNESISTNNIQITPDINNDTTSINIEFSLSSIQNDSINNSCYITLSNNDGNNAEVITISYNNSIARTNEEQEIMELTDSNTAIANNYSTEEFSTFITSWINLFSQRLTEKMAILGFEINT